MQYPKPIMSITELTEMGFSRDYLYNMVRRNGQKFCTRKSNKRRSHFMIDTELFEKERMKTVVR